MFITTTTTTTISCIWVVTRWQ